MIYSYYLSLGSNIGQKLSYLKKALNKLNEIGSIKRKSTIYQSKAWGYKDQPDFFNGMVEYQSKLCPEKLLVKIKEIEHEIGRRNTGRWRQREIDIDIIFCKGITVNKSELHIPHKEFDKRLFVLVLMAELDESYVVEGTNKTIKYFLRNCPDKLKPVRVDLQW